MKTLRVKAYISFKLWTHLFIKGACSPFSLFSLLCLLCSILLAYNDGDFRVVISQIQSAIYSLKIFAKTFPIWIFTVACISAFQTRAQIKSRGQWIGNRFYFNKPELIQTLHIEQSHNDQRIPIKFSNVPKNIFIGYKVEYDRGLAKIQIGCSHNQWQWINRSNQSGGFRYPGKINALANCPTGSDLTTARIFQTYWEAY